MPTITQDNPVALKNIKVSNVPTHWRKKYGIQSNDVFKKRKKMNEFKKQNLDFSDPNGKELLMQASRVFGVNSRDNEPYNFAKPKK
jgi:hypothetical protein